MSDSKALKLSNLIEKQKQVYEVFKDLHPQYIDKGGKSAELSNIIRSIMDKAYPPKPPEIVEQAMVREESAQQLLREQSAALPMAKEAKPTSKNNLKELLLHYYPLHVLQP